MTKHILRFVGLAGLGALLAGCHALHSMTRACSSDATGYEHATSIAPLRVPPGLDAPDTRSALQIPVLNEPAPPARSSKDPCLEEPPQYEEPKVPRPVPAA
ncbi:MAG TPA: hypothetical protein VMB48_06335 [Steroidobacteraceae bacterium]|nr:hypothetical protein [Steroidobacteraceae bacterium]